MDVVDLKEFYASPLGQASRRIIAQRIRSRWGNLSGSRFLGLGFATPYMDAVREEAQAVLGFMPAEMGVSHWPAEGGSATALVDEIDLPLPDSCIDCALIVHGLELTQNLNDMLQELWRVLAPQGRALFVVPNRRGMWARFDSTPFGHGRPFSRQQLTQMLREAQFSPSGWSQALFVPPIRRAFFIRSAVAWERMGLRLSPGFAGVIIVEAVKQVHAISTSRRVRRLAPSLKPAFNPQPALTAVAPPELKMR
ncbi:MAG: class I SAM-dependent methyltransferase [Pseudomonadota bacterium]|nr:class I SAM-dependent methyltransferase [Pseudomonadota bacterium]